MKFRIIASLLVIVVLLLLAAVSEGDSRPKVSAPSSSGIDDSSMKNFKID